MLFLSISPVWSDPIFHLCAHFPLQPYSGQRFQLKSFNPSHSLVISRQQSIEKASHRNQLIWKKLAGQAVKQHDVMQKVQSNLLAPMAKHTFLTYLDF
jgi:hypothetical protein